MDVGAFESKPLQSCSTGASSSTTVTYTSHEEVNPALSVAKYDTTVSRLYAKLVALVTVAAPTFATTANVSPELSLTVGYTSDTLPDPIVP